MAFKTPESYYYVKGLVTQALVGYNVPRMHTITWVEQQLAIIGIIFCFECHRSCDAELVKCTLSEFLPEITSFPPTLMQCEDKDFLLFGNRGIVKKMKAEGLQVHYTEYKARHCYAGLPPVWMNSELRAEATATLSE